MELPRPEVTVSDPREPGALVAVAEPPPRRLGRRGAALLTAAVLVGATGLLTADVVRDRRAAAEQRRLDGVVDVALATTSGRWSSSHDPATRTGTVDGVVRLRNLGRRDLRVESAQLGRMRFDGALVLPAGGGAAVVPLRRTVRCPAGDSPPPPQRQDRVLRVRLDTPAGPRELSFDGDGLPLGSLADTVSRACAAPPLRDTVRLAAAVVAVQQESVDLRVTVVNEGRRPVRLLSVLPARGLVLLPVDGQPSESPVLVPAPTPGQQAVLRLQRRVSAVCGALLAKDASTPFEQLSAIVEDVDRTEMTSVTTVADDPDRQLRQLAERTCASG